MNKRILLGLIIGLLAAGFVVSLPRYIPNANAITGTVCLGDPNSTAATGATPCPTSAPTFSGPQGNQLRVAVFIQASDALNGFDITLKATHTILTPLGVDIAGTVLPGTATPIALCVGGILKQGVCSIVTDNIDTLHYAVSGLGSGVTNPPTSGLLFTAIYNITGTGNTALAFQTGCGTGTPTSVPPNTCVTISGGSTTAVAETAQASTFNSANLPPYLTLSASSANINSPGSTALTLTGAGGWPPTASGVTDSITFTTQPPQHVTASVSPGSCTPSIPCSPLSLSVSGTGTGPVLVLGTYQTGSGTVTETLVATTTVQVGAAPGCSAIGVSPATVMGASGAASATVTLTCTAGFTGPASLSLGTVIPAGLTATFTTPTFTGTTGTSTATFSGAANAYTVNVKAVVAGKTITSTPPTHVTITPSANPDFSLSANPTSVSGTVNIPAASQVTATASGGFTGNIALTVTPTYCSVTPATVTGGSGTSTLSCTATTAGPFTATVTGTSGSLTHTQTVSFTIAAAGLPHDFTVTASPTTVPVTAGMSGTSTITVTGLDGITGTVTLAPAVTPTTGLACQLSSTSITLGTTPGTSILTCTAATTATGTFTVDIAGSNTTVTKHATVTFNVSGGTTPGFTLTPDQTSVTCTPGQQKTVTITAAAQGGFTGTIALVAPVITGGTTGGLTGTLSSSSIANGAGTSTLTLTCTTAGNYNVAVTGTSGTLSAVTANVTVTVASALVKDFTIMASPASVACTAGMTGMTTITVSPINGYAEIVQLGSLSSPAGLTGTFSPTSITGGSGSSTLTFNCTTANSYTVTVTGTGETKTHTTSVTVTVTAPAQGTFTIGASPSSVTCSTGGTASSTVTIASQNGFTGNVNLQTIVLPFAGSPSNGLTATLSLAVIMNGAGTSNLNLSCHSAGTFDVGITGMSGTIVKWTNVTATVTSPITGGFSISTSPSSISVLQGCTNVTTVTLTSLGFSGGIDLTTKISPANTGVSADLSKIHATIGVDASKHIVLTISADSTATVGSYTVTVTAVGGSTTHTATVHVTVKANSCVSNDDSHENNCGSQHDDDNEAQTCNAGSNDNKGDDHNSITSTDKEDGAVHVKELHSSCQASDDDEAHTGNNCGCPTTSKGDENENHGTDQDHGQKKAHEGAGDNEKNKCSVSCGTSDNDNGQKTGLGEQKNSDDSNGKGSHNGSQASDNETSHDTQHGICTSSSGDLKSSEKIDFSTGERNRV